MPVLRTRTVTAESHYFGAPRPLKKKPYIGKYFDRWYVAPYRASLDIKITDTFRQACGVAKDLGSKQ